MTANPEFEQRIGRFQRPGDGGYLLSHWDNYTSRRYREICGLVLAIVTAGDKPKPGEMKKVRVVEYGTSSGALFRALEHYLGHRYQFEFIAIDADRRALGFLRGKFPNVAIHEADPTRLCELVQQIAIAADIGLVMSTFYAFGEDDTQQVIDAMGRIAPVLIVADQIERFAQSKSGVLSLKDYTERPYDAVCHPFKKLFMNAGYSACAVLPAAEPVKSLSGFVVATREQTDLSGLANAVSETSLSNLECRARQKREPAIPATALPSDLLIPPPAINFNQRTAATIQDYERDYKETACLKEFPFLMRRAGLRPNSTILDYGCGLGRHAYAASKFLSDEGRYFGFDINPPAIDFLRSAYSGLPHFAFHGETLAHDDDYIAIEYEDHHGSDVRATSVNLRPLISDHMIDLQFSWSVFTHMWPGHIAHVLRHVREFMRPSGFCINTWFMIDEFAAYVLRCGVADRVLPYQFGDALTYSKNNPMNCAAYPEAKIRSIYQSAGHEIVEILPGSWSGRDNGVIYQDIIVSKIIS
jgi:SAM-dependent methyltransferase